MGQSLSLHHYAPRPVRSHIPWPSLQSGTIALVACFCLALIGSEAWQLWRVHTANIQQTEIVTSNTVVGDVTTLEDLSVVTKLAAQHDDE